MQKILNMKCKICLNDSVNKPFSIKEMMFGTKEEFLYSQCSVCGSLQLIDVPKNMAKYYKDGYYSVDNRLHLTEPKKVFDKIRRIFY